MLTCQPRIHLARVARAVRPVVQGPLRVGLATGLAAVMSLGTVVPARAEQVRVVETSLGLADNTRLLRHLALRIGSDDNFVEAHFGPGGGGDMRNGFLNTGKGKVADSEYLNIIDAGETSLSKEEVLAWCEEWAKDRVYLTIGQNCWTMVYTFLETHEGCVISDDLKFKETQVNQATQALVRAADSLAEQEGRTTEEVMNEVMDDPKRLLTLLFTVENMENFADLDLSPVVQAVRKGKEMGDALPYAVKKVLPATNTADATPSKGG